MKSKSNSVIKRINKKAKRIKNKRGYTISTAAVSKDIEMDTFKREE